jgi:hypothetical protein
MQSGRGLPHYKTLSRFVQISYLLRQKTYRKKRCTLAGGSFCNAAALCRFGLDAATPSRFYTPLKAPNLELSLRSLIKRNDIVIPLRITLLHSRHYSAAIV